MNKIDYDHPAEPSKETGNEKRDTLIHEGEPRAEGENATLASDNPSPFSSALHIPTLVEEPAKERDSHPHPDDPAPFSSLLGVPVLLRQNAPSQARSSNQSRYPAEADAAAVAERRLTSTLSGEASAHLAGFSRLDLTAALCAAIMTLGPLFAAFVGRIE